MFYDLRSTHSTMIAEFETREHFELDSHLLMALITISGYPASGKTRRAQQLKSFLERRLAEPTYEGPKFKVILLSDDSLNIKRHVYDGPSML